MKVYFLTDDIHPNQTIYRVRILEEFEDLVSNIKLLCGELKLVVFGYSRYDRNCNFRVKVNSVLGNERCALNAGFLRVMRVSEMSYLPILCSFLPLVHTFLSLFGK